MMYTDIPTQRPHTPLLNGIDEPQQLRLLTAEQLNQLATELRLYLLYAAGQSGGHFGANLGVVELSIVLHYCFNTPNDRLLWDVGHQAYAHKALTGRREQLTRIRSKDGLAAFPSRDESIYDSLGVGHSSTAISAGLGMALASRYQQQNRHIVAVVGDGAMTAGMAFEAMNDAVAHQADLLVILNDNDMSISCSVGGFAQHLAGIWQNGQCVTLNDADEVVITDYPNWDYTSRLHQPASQSVGNLFQAIGFEYFGPFDGHDIPQLLKIINAVKKRKGPRLIHVYTRKGKGFLPAEQDPITYHAIGKINATPTPSQNTTKKLKYADVFGQWLCDTAQHETQLMAITPAMCEGSGMVQFAKQFPQRFFDVAIAEQHAVTLAAGMACEGLKPVVAIYSTFLQRGYDQFIHDVALQNLDVTFALDRAGLVGEDGATHAGVFDLAYLRCVPNVIIATPSDENECYQLLNTCYAYQGVSAIRYPRGTGVGAEIQPNDCNDFSIGKGRIVWHHPQQTNVETIAKKHLVVLNFGTRLADAQTAVTQLVHDELAITLCDMRWVKPLDSTLIDQLIQRGASHIATIEEHQIMGGAGSAVNEYLLNQGIVIPIKNIGIRDEFIPHASHQQQLEMCGLDAKGILQQLQQFLGLND